jgi:hypothetical protein
LFHRHTGDALVIGMRRSELLSRSLIAAGTLLALGIPLFFWTRTPLIHARMADTGGWTPEVIKANVGEPLHLSLTSDDVVHGFAVGQMEMESVDIEPGKVTAVTLTFDRPGIYTFFCTRWCGLNHWRMPWPDWGGGYAEPACSTTPLYVDSQYDIDAPQITGGARHSTFSSQRSATGSHFGNFQVHQS